MHDPRPTLDDRAVRHHKNSLFLSHIKDQCVGVSTLTVSRLFVNGINIKVYLIKLKSFINRGHLNKPLHTSYSENIAIICGKQC